jgi:hypothetical protein
LSPTGTESSRSTTTSSAEISEAFSSFRDGRAGTKRQERRALIRREHTASVGLIRLKLRRAELGAETIAAALSVVPVAERPDLVRVVDEIPVTTWYRPSAGPLREAGAPVDEGVWRCEGES